MAKVKKVKAGRKPAAKRTGGRPKAEILADLRERLSMLPVSVNVGQPISHRLDHMLSGVRAEIALKIFGEDLDGLRTIAENMRQRLSGIPGLVDLQVEKQTRIPQLEVRIDYQRAALYGCHATIARLYHWRTHIE